MKNHDSEFTQAINFHYRIKRDFFISIEHIPKSDIDSIDKIKALGNITLYIPSTFVFEPDLKKVFNEYNNIFNFNDLMPLILTNALLNPHKINGLRLIHGGKLD